MKKVLIVLTSARANSAGDNILPLVEKSIGAHPELSATVVDFRKTPLPFFNEQSSPSMPDYVPTDANAAAWAAAVAEADAVLILSAEYNYGYTAVIKNAVDYLSPETWKDKHIYFVGYGWGGGAKAIDKLRTLFTDYLAAVPSDTEANLRFTKEINPDGTSLDESAINDQIQPVVSSIAG